MVFQLVLQCEEQTLRPLWERSGGIAGKVCVVGLLEAMWEGLLTCAGDGAMF